MMKQKKLKILLITDHFPYSYTEQFLETEIKYYKNIHVEIMPQHNTENVRTIENKEIKVDDFLINNYHSINKNKFLFTMKMFFSSYFFKELINKRLFSMKRLKSFRASMLYYYHYYNIFNNYFLKQDDLKYLTVYTYWNDEATYALSTLKKKYGYKLVSRIHGYDLYEERRVDCYMPLKSQFINDIDKLYTITETANEYLHKVYGVKNNLLKLNRLGVEDKNIISNPNKKNILHIVSCSYLKEVKQVHKIVEALAIIGKKNPQIKYIWTHIGDGELYDYISNLAKNMILSLDNIEYNLEGHMDNKDVYQFYKDNNVDVFINVSKSEGVPVSIMEAMSCYIPVIAPNIGGISDMVTDGVNGILLSDRFKIIDIIVSLEQKEYFKDINTRVNSYKRFFIKYNAKINYVSFINELKK